MQNLKHMFTRVFQIIVFFYPYFQTTNSKSNLFYSKAYMKFETNFKKSHLSPVGLDTAEVSSEIFSLNWTKQQETRNRSSEREKDQMAY